VLSGWRRFQGLNLLLEVLILLDELREALLDLVDELVNFQHLIAGLAGHPEPLVPNVVKCQRHRAPRYLGGPSGEAGRLTRPTVPNLMWAYSSAKEVL